MGFRSLRLFFPFPFAPDTAPEATFLALSIACFLRLSLPFMAGVEAGRIARFCTRRRRRLPARALGYPVDSGVGGGGMTSRTVSGLEGTLERSATRRLLLQEQIETSQLARRVNPTPGQPSHVLLAPPEDSTAHQSQKPPGRATAQ